MKYLADNAISVAIAAVIVAAAAAQIAQRLGWLPTSSTAEAWKSNAEAEAAKAQRLQRENDELRAEKVALEATRSLRPVLELLARTQETLERNTQQQRQVLDKLVDVNGSLKHVYEATERLASRVADELADRRPSRRRSA